MMTAQIKNRDPLILRQTLLDLAAHLQSANASGSREQQAVALDDIFHRLAQLGIGDDNQLSHPIINLALQVQRQSRRTDLKILKDAVRKAQNELKESAK